MWAYLVSFLFFVVFVSARVVLGVLGPPCAARGFLGWRTLAGVQGCASWVFCQPLAALAASWCLRVRLRCLCLR